MDNADSAQRLHFGRFLFDGAGQRLLSQDRSIPLPPKAVGVLATLLQRAGQLVTKNDLLDVVWGHRHVSESVLKTIVSDLRTALDDDARQPRFIETVARRGYRFIGTIDGQRPDLTQERPSQAPADPALAPDFIGRQDSLGRLGQAWARAADAQRQMFFLAGEAGIGKTTLIDAFVATLGDVAVARGQCIEQLGDGEAYLPVLEALAGLGRTDAALVPLMRRVAPTWLLQLPWLIEPSEQAALRAALDGSTQDRMLREFSELVEQWTQSRPLLLVTEDLHWCDEATVRLIDHVARRRPPAHLMWLASYRTPELVARDHPLNGLRHDLRLRRLCQELLLEPFSEAELAAYLKALRPAMAVDDAQVHRLYRQTDGLPLFVANLLDEWSEGPEPAPTTDEWAVSGSLAGIIERQLGRMTADTTDMLEAAAVCGVEFSCAMVARMLDRETSAVEAVCQDLARRQAWLAPTPFDTLADGALDLRFTFRHAVYRQVLYQRMSAAACVRLNRRAASAIAQLRPERLDELAGLLALHFERGREARSAVRCYATAGERALGRFAPREAMLLADRGLALVDRYPEMDSRDEADLALQSIKGAALAQSTGACTPQARAAFQRCSGLLSVLPPTRQHAWALAGMAWVPFACGEFDEAERVAVRVLEIGEAFDDDLIRATVHTFQAAAQLQRGRLAESWALLERSRVLFATLADVSVPHTLMQDPVTLSFGLRALVHALRGEATLARRSAQDAMDRAAQIARPMVQGFAARCANMVEIRFHGAEALLARATRMREVVADYRIDQAEGVSLAMLGWARAQTGDPAQGLRETEEGIARHLATGARFEATCLHRLVADAALLDDRLETARHHLEQGFAMAASTAEALHLPDLWLTRARLAAREADPAAARAAAEAAAQLAGQQGALTVALVAHVFLCDLEDTTAADLARLRAVRARWTDASPWALLSCADARLSAAD